MPLNNQPLGSLQPSGVKLSWPKKHEGWPAYVGRVYDQAKREPVVVYWFQMDVEIFWLLCHEYAKYSVGSNVGNAAMFKELQTRFDAIGISFLGRRSHALDMTEEKDLTVTDLEIQELADILRAGEYAPDEEILDAEVIEDADS